MHCILPGREGCGTPGTGEVGRDLRGSPRVGQDRCGAHRTGVVGRDLSGSPGTGEVGRDLCSPTGIGRNLRTAWLHRGELKHTAKLTSQEV